MEKTALRGEDMTLDEYEKLKADALNCEPGNLFYYDCHECKNKGYTVIYKNGGLFFRECRCMALRRSRRHLEKSGLCELLNYYTFDSFTANEKWQAEAKKMAEVLYIDDFLKTQKGSMPTPGDINLAFEILNFRYINKNLITVISSERTLPELLEADEAVGSRIFERCKNSQVTVTGNHNQRLKKL